MSVTVRVPIVDATAWDPWLTTELGVQAGKMGLGYDGGEEEGDFEVFDFEGDVDTVERAVVVALAANGIHRPTVKDSHTVTVAGEMGRWLVSYAPTDTAYGKAMRRVARELSDDQRLTEWFAGTGLRKLWWHESHDPGRPAAFLNRQEPGELSLMHFTDLTILDEKPSKAEAERVAREHVRDVLEQVARYLNRPLP